MPKGIPKNGINRGWFTNSPRPYKKISLARIGKSSPKKGKEYPHLQGENSSRWIEDRSRIKKSDKKHLDCGYISWMLKVKRRDNWKCKIENLDCKGRLEAHHILP